MSANNGLTIADVKGLDYDDPAWELLLDQMTLKEMENLITNAAFSTAELKSIGQAATAERDGPQGISAWIVGLQGVGYPIEIYIAQTWNPEIAEEQGHLMGSEARESGLSGMYAPGVNIHRTPYAGRNFEYYAEDGYLAGKMAAAFVCAAGEEGVFMSIKPLA